MFLKGYWCHIDAMLCTNPHHSTLSRFALPEYASVEICPEFVCIPVWNMSNLPSLTALHSNLEIAKYLV